MSSAKPRAAVVYMARSTSRDLNLLKRSLSTLDRYFNRAYGYPVIIFNEDFDEAVKADLTRSTSSALTFARLDFSLPPWVDASAVPEKILGRFPVGYRHMCRFFAGGMYSHPALDGYDWYWRLDTDSFLRAPINYDVFEFMAARDLWYGYIVMLKERPEVVVGLWDAMRRYITDKNISNAQLDNLLSPAGDWNLDYIYNNFEICSLAWTRSAPYQEYFDYLDRLGGIYLHRWGDAPIRTFAVSMLAPADKVHRFTDIAYSHAGYYTHLRHRVWDRAASYLTRS